MICSVDEQMILNQCYGQSWIAFRQLTGENTNLVDVVTELLRDREFPEGFTLIDAGAGDATLTCELVTEPEFGASPGLIHCLEPIEFLRREAKLHTKTLLKPERLPTNVSSERLSEFFHSPHVDIPGLVLAVHSSYYFDDLDIEKLIELKRKGYRGVLIENTNNCWVSNAMKLLGNDSHPQFVQNRLPDLVERLGRDVRVSTSKKYSVDFQTLTIERADSLLDFFGCCRESIPQRFEASQKLIDAMNHEINDPFFEYQIVSW